ncbi:MAG: acetylglutamate kinase [Clostridia bacterium]|nr:acetylglutamate kinase [Clostridia bacterium]MDD4146355.1 acetylglutamate kinase [Clostridia bacterium]MDD4665201.1 acetylglutamate kinase [Clostridia bacterium]
MLDPTKKAAILVEALPYIQKFFGKTVLIKLGGHAMLNSELEKLVLQDIVLMKLVGMNPVIVHGGGPDINKWLEKTGHQSTFVQGMRVTDEKTIKIVEMVLSGNINKEIVGLINALGGKAVGISGKDGNLIQVEKKQFLSKDQTGTETKTDLGLVGEIKKINPEIIDLLTAQGFIPVVSPLGIGPQGKSYNINADHVAGALGGALQADKLVMLTDVEGIYLGEDSSSLASQLSIQEIYNCLQKGIIKEGMIPKVESCLLALKNGVANVHIIDGRKPHALLLEIFTNKGIGTMIVKEHL